jgi:hypothetical protein
VVDQLRHHQMWYINGVLQRDNIFE